MFSMALQQFGASALAQKKTPFSTSFLEFWNTFGTAGSDRLESRVRSFDLNEVFGSDNLKGNLKFHPRATRSTHVWMHG